MALIAILLVAPDVYAEELHLAESARIGYSLAFLAALIVFIAFLGLGVMRRWRWMFWLILVAFLAGALRVPASVLELAGVIPASTPAWYVALQGAIGVVQLGIGLALYGGYRKGGVWGAF